MTGPCAKTSGRTSACSSNGYSASTATRPTNKRKRRSRCWSRRRCFRRYGRREDLI